MGGLKSKQQVFKSTMDVAGCTTTSLNTIQPRRHIIQNYLLIWIDGNINETNEDCQNTLAQLRRVVNEVTICAQPAQCIRCLNDADDEKAFVISSGTLGQHLVPQIHDMPQVDAIYIFCGDESRHKTWTKEWPKIQGVFTSINPICESLKRVARQCDHDKMPMSFISKQMMQGITSDQLNLDQLEPAYIYSFLFKEIILEIDEDDAKSVKELVIYCRQQKVSEFELNDFQRQYHEKSPVRWYTSDIVLYSMLNRALWSLDMEAMAKMGFFIRNLHRQLKQLHQKQSDTFKKQFNVYRGQELSQQDFDHLCDTKGGFLSFNNFLSTSTEKHIAMKFVKRTLRKDKDTVSVLFIMTINPNEVSGSRTPFALIEEYSAIRSEEEILFSIHTVFRVDEIKQTVNNSHLWEVQLTFTDDNDRELAVLSKRIREEIGGTGWYRMGKLMHRLGNLNQAEELYNELLKNASGDSDRAYIYHQLGWLKNDQGQYKAAVLFYEKAIKINRKTLPEDHRSLADNYLAIGLVYNNMHDYSKALDFYDKALKRREKTLPPDHPDLATVYNNIGKAYSDMGNYSQALSFLEKALAIRQKSLPSTHPLIKTLINNIDYVKKNM